MWTDRHRPYYSLVRSEDEKHKKKLAPTTVAATTQTNISSHTDGGAAMQNTNAFSSTNNNGTFATAGTTTMASERYDGSKTNNNNNNNNRSSSNSGESDGKVLDPVKALRLARTAIKDTREVTCCRKAITQLHPNFLFFENLEVLILNKNHLRSAKNLIPSSARDANGGDTKSSTALCGPRGCIRLRQLHLSDNRISDLQDTDIPRLGTLEQLYLANNRLTNLMLVVRILKNRLPSLVYLDLRGNPIAEEYGYRPFVVNSLPNLKVLDRLAITATERREAKEHCAALQLQQQQQQQPAVAEAMHSPRPPIKTEVAFSSTYRPQEAPEAPRQGLWSKSRCVVMMEQRHDNYLEDAEQQKEAAAQAEADRINLMKNTRTAFHAVWALSRAPLPLAEQKQREWRQSEAEAAAGGAASVADGAASEAPNLSTTTNSTNRSPQRRALHTSGNNGSSAILSAASVGDSATANNAELTATTVKIPRDVLETALPDSTSNEDPDNASVMYDALLHKRDVVAEKTVKGNSSWAAASTPSAVRLRDMSTAIQTTTDMLQIGANGLMSSSLGGTETGVALTVSSPKRTRGAKAVVSVRRRNSRSAVQSAPPTSSSAAAAAATINVSTAQLRRVADNTHAFIPSPWEDPSGAGSCGATSAIATPEALRLSQLEAQGHALQLVKLLLLPHECVSLETYFGAGEVLQVLGIDQARKMSLPPAGAATTGQQQQQQQRHRPGTNANSGRKGRQSAATQAVTAGLLQDAALLHLMTTSQLGPASLLPMHATAAAAQQGLSSATSSAATPPPQQQQQQQSLVVLPGLVGPYQLGSLGDFMGRLDSQSGAWSVPMQPLLNAIAARHQVNLATSAPRADAVKSSGTADSARDADTSKRSDSPGLSSRRGGKREEKEDRKLRTPASRGASTGTGGGSGGRRRQGGRGAAEDQPAVTAASIAAAAAARPKSWLTINNIAGALLCYIPFVESRLAYFKSKCTQCATAARGSNGSGGADEAMVWFSRAQGAQQHLEALQKAGPSPVDGQGALVDFSFLSARSVRPIGTAFGELL